MVSDDFSTVVLPAASAKKRIWSTAMKFLSLCVDVMPGSLPIPLWKRPP